MTVTKDDLKCRIEEYAKGNLDTSSKVKGKFVCPSCGSGTGKRRTPALSIDKATDLFKCFSCGVGGDIFDLAGLIHGISNTPDTFRERLQLVADYFGEIVEGCSVVSIPKKTQKYHYWNRPKIEKSWTDLTAYDYRNENGEVVGSKFKGVNENGEKDSRWEIKILEEGQANTKLTSVKNGLPPFYNLPEALSSEDGGIIFFCEGEKDADRLLKEGISEGWIGISVPNGASDEISLKKASEDSGIVDALSRAAAIVACGDFDEAGEKYDRNIKKIFDNAKIHTPILKLSWTQLDPDHCKGYKEKDDRGKVTGKYIFDLGKKYDISDFFDNHENALNLLKSHVEKKLERSKTNRESAKKRTDRYNDNVNDQNDQDVIDVSDVFGSVDSTLYPHLKAYVEEYSRICDNARTWIAEAERKGNRPSNADILTVAYYRNLSLNIPNASEEVLKLADLVCESAVIPGKRPCSLMEAQVKQVFLSYYNAFIQDGAMWAYRPEFGDYYPFTASQISSIYNDVALVLDGYAVQTKKQTFGEFVVASNTLDEDMAYPEKKFIAFKNGTLDLEKMELVDHSPEHHLKFSIDAELDFSLVNDDRKWEEVKKESAYYKFLYSVLPSPEDTKVVDAYGALLLSPHAEEVQLYFCPYGTGANGKSVLLNFWKSLICDSDTRVADVSVESLVRDSYQSEIIIGKTHVICDDASDLSFQAIDHEFFKKSVTGGTVLINPKNRKNFNATPNLFMAGAVNRLPVSKANLNASFRRLGPIEFVAKAGTREEVERGEKLIVKDTNLLNRLKEEKSIAVVAYVRALKELQKTWSIPETSSVIEAKEDIKTNSSSLQRFLVDYCEITGNDDDVISQHLFHDYLEEFALSENSKASVPSIRSISQQIKGDARVKTLQSYDSNTKKRVRFYTGIRVDGWKRQRLEYRFNDNEVKEKLLSRKWSITEVTEDNLDLFTPPVTASNNTDKEEEIRKLKAEVERLNQELISKYLEEMLDDSDFELIEDEEEDEKNEQRSVFHQN